MTGVPPLSTLWVSDSNAFRKLGCTHSQFLEGLGYIHDPENPGVLNEVFLVFLFSQSFQINAGILILCRDSDSEKAIPFPSTSLLFYFEGKLSVPKKQLFVEKINASGDIVLQLVQKFHSVYRNRSFFNQVNNSVQLAPILLKSILVL
jgi:hypothetical protein